MYGQITENEAIGRGLLKEGYASTTPDGRIVVRNERVQLEWYPIGELSETLQPAGWQSGEWTNPKENR